MFQRTWNHAGGELFQKQTQLWFACVKGLLILLVFCLHCTSSSLHSRHYGTQASKTNLFLLIINVWPTPSIWLLQLLQCFLIVFLSFISLRILGIYSIWLFDILTINLLWCTSVYRGPYITPHLCTITSTQFPVICKIAPSHPIHRYLQK